VRDDSDPFAELVELQPAWVKTFDLPGGDGAHWAILPNSDSVEIRAEVVQPTVNVWSFGVWYWPEALAVVLALLVLVTGRWWWLARRGKEPRCRKCRYELTNLKSDACPECGTALTPRNRVIGMRSRWRMALAPVALLVIGSAWWFGESHVPRHGWVSEKVQWHWAFPRDRVDWSAPWYQVHGGRQRVRLNIDVASGRADTYSLSELPLSEMYVTDIVRFNDAKRAWGRFPGSELIWSSEKDSQEIVLVAPDGTRTRVAPPMGGNVVLVKYAMIGFSYMIMLKTNDASVYYPFLPDPTGNGWFILVGNELIHQDFVTGEVSTVLNAAEYIDLNPLELRHWHFEPVLASKSLAILRSGDGVIIDLATRGVVARVVGDDPPKQVAVAVIAAGKEEAAKELLRQIPDSPTVLSHYVTDLTEDKSYMVRWRLSLMVGKERLYAGLLDGETWNYQVVTPQSLPHRAMETFTTGPGPRDVNVFFIDGGQLILAVYELPEAE